MAIPIDFIGSLYRLSIVSFYRHHYIKNIWIVYNVVYKKSLYFGIGVGRKIGDSSQDKNCLTATFTYVGFDQVV